MQLQDGVGNGYWGKIDQYNRLKTYSTNITEVGDISVRHGLAFSITMDIKTFNSTNEHPWLYLRNDNPNMFLFFSSIVYTFNGGDTNHNRCMTKKVYRNPSIPTNHFNELTSTNLNMGSNNPAVLTAYGWDGSENDGMDVDLSDKTSLSTSLVSKGSLLLSDIESVILQYGNSILFTYTPEEIGKASISLKIYFNHQEG
jgi:hypothetical protein